METINISWYEIGKKIDTLKNSLANKNEKIFGISKGGKIIAALTGHGVEEPEQANIFLDDLYNTGKNYNKWIKKFPNKEYCFLFNQQFEFKNKLIIFPY
tara:strand:+ start:155 stop:451 length:297 start_codon:yes stop_codon:yes gene_type:complete